MTILHRKGVVAHSCKCGYPDHSRSQGCTDIHAHIHRSKLHLHFVSLLHGSEIFRLPPPGEVWYIPGRWVSSPLLLYCYLVLGQRKKNKIWCFLYVSFDIIFVWARGIYKHSLHAAFSVGATQLYSCITSPLQWPGHILFSLRVASLSSLSNCSKYNSRVSLLCWQCQRFGVKRSSKTKWILEWIVLWIRMKLLCINLS